MQDIAERLGVSVAAVSMALRGSTRVSRELRERVRATADELGYRVDPGLREAMKRVRSRRHGPNLAVLCALPEGRHIRHFGLQREQIAGMRARVEELGYGLEEFYLHGESCDHERLRKVLWARGVGGVVLILVPGTPTTFFRELDLSEMAVLALGYEVIDPPVNRLAPSVHTGITMAVETALAEGRRRLALVVEEFHEAAAEHRHEIAFHGSHEFHDCPGVEFRTFTIRQQFTAGMDELTRDVFAYKPDLMLTNYPGWAAKWAEMSERCVPDDLAIISFEQLDPYVGRYTCLDYGLSEQGADAIDLLLADIYLSKTGVPARAKTVQIEPLWARGESFPCLPPARWHRHLAPPTGSNGRAPQPVSASGS